MYVPKPLATCQVFGLACASNSNAVVTIELLGCRSQMPIARSAFFLSFLSFRLMLASQLAYIAGA